MVLEPGEWHNVEKFVASAALVMRLCGIEWTNAHELSTCVREMAKIGFIEIQSNGTSVLELEADEGLADDMLIRIKPEYYISGPEVA